MILVAAFGKQVIAAKLQAGKFIGGIAERVAGVAVVARTAQAGGVMVRPPLRLVARSRVGGSVASVLKVGGVAEAAFEVVQQAS